MKTTLINILILILLTGCFNSSQKSVDIIETDMDSTLDKKQNEISGLWVMTDYVDSILAHKTISKYRMQWPTWFAILIDIDKDTLRTYGSILDNEEKYSIENDTLCIFKRTVSGEWTLTLNQSTRKIELRNTNSGRDSTDNKVYVFEKRPEFRFILDTLDKFHKTKTSFTKYFNNEIFTGTYKLLNSNEDIVFSKNGTVNFQDFDTYEVRVYFGTLHPHKNKDVITFMKYEGEQTFWKQYHWQFFGDTLVLTNFVKETIIYDDKEVITDDWILGNDQIKMIKK